MATWSAVLEVTGNLIEGTVGSWIRRASVAVAERARRSDEPAKVLTLLSPREKALLHHLLEADDGRRRSATLPGAAVALELAEVVVIELEPGAGGGYVVGLSAWAMEQLRRHPRLLAARAAG